MSEYTDAMIDKMLNYVPQRNMRRRGFQYGAGMHKWRLGNGKLIEMRSMTTEHLENAIKLCDAKGNTAKKQQLQDVLDKRQNKEAA